MVSMDHQLTLVRCFNTKRFPVGPRSGRRDLILAGIIPIFCRLTTWSSERLNDLSKVTLALNGGRGVKPRSLVSRSLCVPGQCGLHREFHDSQGYVVRPCPKNLEKIDKEEQASISVSNIKGWQGFEEWPLKSGRRAVCAMWRSPSSPSLMTSCLTPYQWGVSISTVWRRD